MKRQRTDSSFKGGGKKRKSYVVHKERETWTDEDHAKFVQALEKHGRAWTKIEEIVGTKTVSQIRSHAQKYFEKLEKQGDMELARPHDGNAVIEVPWIALPDVLGDKPFILNRDNFSSWMVRNNLGTPRRQPPSSDSNEAASIAREQSAQAVAFLESAVNETPSPPNPAPEQEKPDQNESKINWNRIMKYISSLAMESLTGSAGTGVSFDSLSDVEKEILRVIMTQNLAAISIDSVRSKVDRFISEFDKSIVSPQIQPPAANPAPNPPAPSHDLSNSMELFSNFVQESSVDQSREEKS